MKEEEAYIEHLKTPEVTHLDLLRDRPFNI